jgi:hypothetical protein
MPNSLMETQNRRLGASQTIKRLTFRYNDHWFPVTEYWPHAYFTASDTLLQCNLCWRHSLVHICQWSAKCTEVLQKLAKLAHYDHKYPKIMLPAYIGPRLNIALLEKGWREIICILLHCNVQIIAQPFAKLCRGYLWLQIFYPYSAFCAMYRPNINICIYTYRVGPSVYFTTTNNVGIICTLPCALFV